MSVRNVVWGLGTVSVVVLMVSYSTSKPPSSHANTHVVEGAVPPEGDAQPAEGGAAPTAGETAPAATQTEDPSARPSGGTTSGSAGGLTSGNRPAPGGSSTSAPPSPTRTTSARKSVNGAVFQAGSWGPFQVRATFVGSKIVAVSVLQHPTGGHSDEINAEAIPQLNAAAVRTQGASGIEAVSGATLSSQAYKRSLQSAIDRSRS